MPRHELLQHRFVNLEFRRSGLIIGLTGTLGIGKSFTARNLLQQSQLRYVMIAANADSRVQAQMILDVLGHQHKNLPQWAQAQLRRLQHGDLLEATDSAQIFSVVAQAQAPFAILLEDWHDASQAQQHYWQVVIEALRGMAKIGVVITSRYSLPQQIETVELELLSESQIVDVTKQELAARNSVPQMLINWLWQRSQGNPLFLVEYIRDLRRQGCLWFDGLAWQWREPALEHIPTTIEALIERTLQQISAASQRILEARALLGISDNPLLWQVVTKLSAEEIQLCQNELENLNIFRGIEFAHPLYKEVVLARMSAVVKTEIAGLAYQFFAPRDPVKAAELSVMAGFDTAQITQLFVQAIDQQSDPYQAALLKARACEYADDETKRILALEAAQVLMYENLKQVPRLAEYVLEIEPLHLQAIGLRARAWARQGKVEAAQVSLELIVNRDREWWRIQALILVESYQFSQVQQLVMDHPKFHLDDDAEIAVAVGQALLQQGKLNALIALFEQVLQKDTTEIAQMRIKSAQGILLTYQNAWQAAELHFQNLLAVQQGYLPKRLWVNIWYNLGRIAHHFNRYKQATEYYGKAAQLVLEINDQRRYIEIQGALAGLYFDSANFEAAERAFLEVRSLSALFPINAQFVEQEGWLSEMYTCWLPPHGGALSLKYAHSALRLARQLEDNSVIFDALNYAANAEAQHGDANTAIAYITEMSERISDPDNEYLVYVARGIALRKMGDSDAAISALETSYQLVSQNPNKVVSTQQVGLELDFARNDLQSARKRHEFFLNHPFTIGAVCAQRYFPQLLQTPIIPQVSIRLEVLGTIRLIYDNKAIPIRGAKRKLLLVLLLEAHLAGQLEATTTDLCDLMYPNTTEGEARAAIKQLVFQIRAQLGTDCIITTANGYALQHVESDAQQFLETGNTALWRGKYLTDIDGIQSTESVRDALYSLLKRRIPSLVQQEPAQAARLAQILLAVEPFDTESLALALQALRVQSNYVSISRVYSRSRQNWLEVGEQLPKRWTDFLKQMQVA